MVNIENDRRYMVYYNNELSRIIGREVGVCSLLKDNNELHGSILVKPMDLFKRI